jgi:serine/threonine protein phosphatase PrpC
LRKQGNTNEEELKSIRNFITNSLSAKNQSDFSIHKISKQEIRENDFFFLCTDGVLENITLEKIESIFSRVESLENLKTTILNECEGKTKDNFTFEIIQPI